MLEDRNNAVPFRSIDLAYEVAVHLFTRQFSSAYSLLNNDGTYVSVARGANDKAETLVFASWTEAVRAADVHCVDFIVNFENRRVNFRHTLSSGGCTWPHATTYPPPELKVYNHATIDQFEPDAEGKQPKPSRLSGAARRKRRRAHQGR